MRFQTLHLMTWFYLCRRSKIDGIEVGIMAGKTRASLIQTKLTAALALIRDYDPRRYRYLRRDVKRIMVFGTPSYLGIWHQDCSMCELTDSYVLASETTPAMLAATLVHEAMHARLLRWGIGYEEDKRARVERICFQAEIAFARRLPLFEMASRGTIISGATRQIKRDPVVWTDEGRLERDLASLQELGCPFWLTALLGKWVLARRRRVRDKQNGRTDPAE